jgi:hypothetical protein
LATHELLVLSINDVGPVSTWLNDTVVIRNNDLDTAILLATVAAAIASDWIGFSKTNR